MPAHRNCLKMLGLLTALSAAAVQAADAPRVCATPEQARQVMALYAQSPQLPTFMSAPKLGMPEAAVLSALPPEQAIGVAGGEFLKVWESLQGWDRALTLVLKGGQVFEIRGRIPSGEPSKISKNFNLADSEAGLGGHLRPDLISAIYAFSLQGQEGPIHGVAFLDAAGESVFGVFLPESLKPTPAEIVQFGKTRALIAGLPRACP